MVLDEESDVVVGMFLQDPQMMTAFDRFPEVLLIDATHKPNQKDIQSRQRQILSWLVDDDVIEEAMKYHKLIGEQDVE